MAATLLTCAPGAGDRWVAALPPPAELAARFPALARPDCDLVDLFPFLEHFQEEARTLWQGTRPGSLRSEPWDQDDAGGGPCTLQAIAVRTATERLLLIGPADDGAAPIRDILQAAREHSLTLERLRKTEAALRDSEQRFRSIADGTPVMIWLSDARGRPVHTNRAWQEFTAIDGGELTAAWAAAVHADDRRAVAERMARGAAEQTGYELEFRLRHRDGAHRWVLASCTPHHDDTGGFAGHVGCCLDVSARKVAAKVLERARHDLQVQLADRTEQVIETNRLLVAEIRERRRAEDRLLAQRAELRRLAERLALAEEEERRRIAAGLHDHVGQALAMAKMHLGMAMEGLAEGPRDRLAQVRSLVEDCIAHSRSLTFELASPALHELGLVAALEGLAADAAKRHGFAATCRDDGRPKPLAAGARTIVYLAVRELLHNVAKHARARSVELSVTADDGWLQVRVADDGVGFAAGDGNGHGAGRGYGLLNVRERIEHLGGEVRVAAKPNRGTSVVLSVPISGSVEEQP